MEIKKTLLTQLDPYRKGVEPTAEEKKARARAAADAPSSAGQSGDKVSLSSAAKLHTTAHAAIQQAPEVRGRLVADIKEKVNAGEYVIDNRKIAEKLLQDEAFLTDSVTP